MPEYSPALERLADRFGIAREFWDWKGRYVPIPADTIVRVLAAFDVEASTPEAADAAWERLEDERWRLTLPH